MQERKIRNFPGLEKLKFGCHVYRRKEYGLQKGKEKNLAFIMQRRWFPLQKRFLLKMPVKRKREYRKSFLLCKGVEGQSEKIWPIWLHTGSTGCRYSHHGR